MMREPSMHRDPREILVPNDMRGNHPSTRAPRRVAARRPVSASAGMGGSLVGFLRGIGGACLARPGEAFGSAVVLVAVGYVTVNALGFQSGPHPAPILPQPAPALANASAAPRAAPTMPVAQARTAPEMPAREPVAPGHAEKPPARDAIGDMLRSADDTTASVTPRPDKGVMQAQRALSKLGYGTLKPDGMMGPSTKAAIEKFERDRKLPVTGLAAGRTLRELVAARAGASKG